MEFTRMVERFFEFSEKLMVYFINAFYMILVAIPLVFIAPMFEQGILNLPLIFIPLVSLYAMGLKSLTFAFYKIYVKKNLYYKPFFWKSFFEKFPSRFGYYLITISLLYVGLTSTFTLIANVSNLFWILFTLITLILLSNIIYTTIQFALYDDVYVMDIVKNSMLLSLMYGVITVGMTIILAALIYYYPSRTFLVVTVGMPIYSMLLIFVQFIIEKGRK